MTDGDVELQTVICVLDEEFKCLENKYKELNEKHESAKQQLEQALALKQVMQDELGENNGSTKQQLQEMLDIIYGDMQFI